MRALTASTLLSLPILLASCASEGSDGLGFTQLSGSCMGTTWSAVLELTESTPSAQDAEALIQASLDAVDAAMSTWKADSDLSRLNRAEAGEPVEVTPDTATVLRLANGYFEMSSGAFDPTVGPLVAAWGFHDYDVDHAAPSQDDIATARARLGWSAIEVIGPTALRWRDDVEVDLSAIAKGYAVDLAADAVFASGVQNFLLEVGGELVLRGVNRTGGHWRVGVDDPLPPEGADPMSPLSLAARRPFAVVEVSGLAVATSGDYRNVRKLGDRIVAHAIDPRTGAPIEHDLASVTVIAPTCAEADALATAALVLGPTEGLALLEGRDGVEGLLLVRRKDGEETRLEARSTGGMAPFIQSIRD